MSKSNEDDAPDTLYLVIVSGLVIFSIFVLAIIIDLVNSDPAYPSYVLVSERHGDVCEVIVHYPDKHWFWGDRSFNRTRSVSDCVFLPGKTIRLTYTIFDMPQLGTAERRFLESLWRHD